MTGLEKPENLERGVAQDYPSDLLRPVNQATTAAWEQTTVRVDARRVIVAEFMKCCVRHPHEEPVGSVGRIAQTGNGRIVARRLLKTRPEAEAA